MPSSTLGVDEFDAIAADVFGDQLILTRAQLAETGVMGGYKAIAAAIKRGTLTELSVSAKRRVITRAGFAAHLRTVNGGQQ